MATISRAYRKSIVRVSADIVVLFTFRLCYYQLVLPPFNGTIIKGIILLSNPHIGMIKYEINIFIIKIIKINLYSLACMFVLLINETGGLGDKCKIYGCNL